MEAGEELPKPVSSLLESMLTDDSGQSCKTPPTVSSNQSAVIPNIARLWGAQSIEEMNNSSLVKVPVPMAIPNFGASGVSSGKKNLTSRPVKSELSKATIQRKNPSVKLKHLSASSAGFSGLTVKTYRKSLDDVSSSPPQESGTSLDMQTGYEPVDQNAPAQENDLELIEETWPGKVCAFCNLGERSQLGQGVMLRLEVRPDFESLRQNTHANEERAQSLANNAGAVKASTGSTNVGSQPNIKKPRLAVKGGRRSSSFDSAPSLSEQQEELSSVGYIEEMDLVSVVEPCGYFYAHRMCATWSKGTAINPNNETELTGVDSALIRAASLRCHLCGSYGASLSCQQVNSENVACPKSYHFPCAVSCGAFLNAKVRSLYCPDHIYQGSISAGAAGSQCAICLSVSNVSNLLFCVTCGKHCHGSCVGLSCSPGVRAGWQCNECKVCVACRTQVALQGVGSEAMPDRTKTLVCETCDKTYHPACIRPSLSTVPKYGWKCKNCRVCGDCGSRTPGSGASSRWHNHYSVCDSCYQQRNKGITCPLCGKAYRHSQREMSQCTRCRKFVHVMCDPESDRSLIQRKKDMVPEYDYTCPPCKQNPNTAAVEADLDAKFTDPMISSESDACISMVSTDDLNVLAPEDSKMKKCLAVPTGGKLAAKKRIGPAAGRPKGTGKTSAFGVSSGTGYNRKGNKVADFNRKRGPKPKMRGVFGAPGVGLQRPANSELTTAGSNGTSVPGEGEPCLENKLILCSAMDSFVVEQDACAMCGSFGLDQEGRLIACAQCGQCYHPYCANVKVTKVILQKGWRCLDCTVCEGCGERHDEARLLLCDECDISYHIYCMEPPLDYVPQGNWKCKWCAVCQVCGANDPGVKSTWTHQQNGSLCGPCASLKNCPSCTTAYSEGELIIQCQQCSRWLHAACDLIRNEREAEYCAEDGYTCLLCRPSDTQPPHLNPANAQAFAAYLNPANFSPQLANVKPQPSSPSPPPATSPVPPTDIRLKTPAITPTAASSQQQFVVDGVALSEGGMNYLRSLQLDQPRRRCRNKNKAEDAEGEADDDGLKDGMILAPREDGRMPEVPEGYAVVHAENGALILRKKRQRNLQKLGIGGFQVRRPWARVKDKEEDAMDNYNTAEVTLQQLKDGVVVLPTVSDEAAKKRKPQRRKVKNKLSETYPVYLQEAFFGRDLMTPTKSTGDSLEAQPTKGSGSDSEPNDDVPIQPIKAPSIIMLSKEEVAVIENRSRQPLANQQKSQAQPAIHEALVKPEEEEDDEEEEDQALKDILPLPGDLLDSDDLVDSIMKEGDAGVDEEGENDQGVDDEDSDLKTGQRGDELTDILGEHINLDTMVTENGGLPNMDCKDVEDIFKGVLTDESQESQPMPDTTAFPIIGATHSVTANVTTFSSTANTMPQQMQNPGVARALSAQSMNTPSPGHLQQASNIGQQQQPPPPCSPYFSEYSSSPGFSPALSEPPPSPWPSSGAGQVGLNQDHDADGAPASANQRNALKWEADEALGLSATISAVLYANTNHPDLKRDFPAWNERWKQIAKIWRSLPADKKAPFLQKARENRAAVRLQKSQHQQTSQDAQSGNTGGLNEVGRRTPEFPSPCNSNGSADLARPVKEPPIEIELADSMAIKQHSANHNEQASKTLVEAHGIRVLTPSEIMRTLPSIGHAGVQNSHQPLQRITQHEYGHSMAQLHQQQTMNQATETERPAMIVHRRSTLETEQERQWKQMQALRQQQQQQQHQQGVAPGTPVQIQPSDPVQPQQQAMPTNQSPTTPGFAAPIQVSRVRPPGEASPNPAGGFVQRPSPAQTPVGQLNQPPTPLAAQVDQRDEGDQGQQLRDLLQRQQQQLPPGTHPSFIKQENLKREDKEVPGIQAPFQHQPRPQFRFPLPPGTPAVGTPVPMQPAQQRMVLQQPQQQHVMQQQQQMRPRFQQNEFRQPIQPVQQQVVPGHPQQADPRVRMMMMQQQQMQMQQQRPVMQQQVPQQMQQMMPGMRQVHPGAVMQQSQPAIQHQQPQQQMAPPTQPTPPVEQVQAESHRSMKLEADSLAPCPAGVAASSETATGDADDDFADFGLGVDDEELIGLGLGNDFDIFEYADPDLHDAMGGVIGSGDEAAVASGDAAEVVGSPSGFNLLEYAGTDLDENADVTAPTPAPVPSELLTPEELNRRRKEEEEKAAQVAQDVSEFQAKLMEITQQKQQQQLKAESSALPSESPAAVPTTPTRPNCPPTPGAVVGPGGMISPQQPVGQQQPPFGGVYPTPPAPPPPYRGPPPPYPGTMRPANASTNQMSNPYGGGQMRPGMSPMQQPYVVAGHPPFHVHQQRRSLLLQDQPLLLEDLLEQEKRELQRQHMQQPVAGAPAAGSVVPGTPDNPFLSDTDFEKLKADVLSGGGATVSLSPPANVHPTMQHMQQPVGPQQQQQPMNMPFQHPQQMPMQRPPHFAQQSVHHQQQPFVRGPMPMQQPQQQWQMQQPPQRSPGVAIPPGDPGLHPALLQSQANNPNSNVRPPLPPPLLPAVAAPPDNPTTEPERQQQLAYEQWFTQQQQLIRLHQTYYETEVNKLRKQRKSLNSRQRQLRKNNQELSDGDSSELDRITAEQQSLQKQLDQIRRQARQHATLVQDYRNKQQKRQGLAPSGTVQPPAESPSGMQGPDSNYGAFVQQSQQQSQQQPMQQLHIQPGQQGMHQNNQQPSPRGVVGRANTPQSPHPLLSPVGHMGIGPRPHMGQQQGHTHMAMQGGPMIQQQQQGSMMGMGSPMGGPSATPPHNVQQMHPQMQQQMIQRQMMNQQQAPQQPQQFQQVRSGPHGSPAMCPTSPQVGAGPVQSPRGMLQQSHQVSSPMMTTPQPSPSPQMQQPVRPMQGQVQRPMPAPSPSPSLLMTHSPMPMAGPMTPGPMTPGAAGQHSSASPMPSPHTAGAGVAAQMQSMSSSSSPRGPLSQHSEGGEMMAMNSPFSPGPMASPQPAVMMVGGPQMGAMRLTSPQNQRQPSPQQAQQQQQPMGPNGGQVRMMNHPGAMNRMPMQHQQGQNYGDQLLQQPGVMMQRPQQQNPQQHIVMQPGQMMQQQQRFMRPNMQQQSGQQQQGQEPAMMIRQRFPMASALQQQAAQLQQQQIHPQQQPQQQQQQGHPAMMNQQMQMQRQQMMQQQQHQYTMAQQQHPMQQNQSQFMQHQQNTGQYQQQQHPQQQQQHPQQQQQHPQQQQQHPQQQQQHPQQQQQHPQQQQQHPQQQQQHPQQQQQHPQQQQQHPQQQQQHPQQQHPQHPQQHAQHHPQQQYSNSQQYQQQFQQQQQHMQQHSMQQQQQHYYNPPTPMRPRAPPTPASLQQQMSVESSASSGGGGGSHLGSPRSVPPPPSPAVGSMSTSHPGTPPSAGMIPASPAPQMQQQMTQQPQQQQQQQQAPNNLPDSTSEASGGGGRMGMNVAPFHLEYDSYGFLKIGLRGGGMGGPYSPSQPSVIQDQGTSQQQQIEHQPPIEVPSVLNHRVHLDIGLAPPEQIFDDSELQDEVEQIPETQIVESKPDETSNQEIEVKNEQPTKEAIAPEQSDQKQIPAVESEILVPDSSEMVVNDAEPVKVEPADLPVVAVTIKQEKMAGVTADVSVKEEFCIEKPKSKETNAEISAEGHSLINVSKEEVDVSDFGDHDQPTSEPMTAESAILVEREGKKPIVLFKAVAVVEQPTSTVHTLEDHKLEQKNGLESSAITSTSVEPNKDNQQTTVSAVVNSSAQPEPVDQMSGSVKQEPADKPDDKQNENLYNDDPNGLLAQQQQQNALLKQLLQGSAAAAAAAASSVDANTSGTTSIAVASSSSSTRPTSLMGLLAKPLTPTSGKAPMLVSASATSTIATPSSVATGTAPTPTAPRPLLGSATSLASQLAQPIAPSQLPIPASQIAQMVSRVPQPPTPAAAATAQPIQRPHITAIKVVQAPQVVQRVATIKQEPQPGEVQQPIKTEVMDESDQSMEATGISSEQTTPEPPLPPPPPRGVTAAPTPGTTTGPSSDEIRKMKRRQYQQKRRQMIASSREQPGATATPPAAAATASPTSSTIIPTAGPTPITERMLERTTSIGATTPTRKRCRKGSKFDEVDYDAFIEATMSQLRASLPPLLVQEPQLSRGCMLSSSCTVFGAGDLTPLPSRINNFYNSSSNGSQYKIDRNGMLKGSYGSATLPGTSDYYNTKPFGDNEPVTPVQTATTGGSGQRGFYHQEFAWPRLDWRSDEGSRSRSSSSCSILLDSREGADSPDTVVSSSSPECVLPEPISRYPALKFIDIAEETPPAPEQRTTSPEIPICAPVPIRAIPPPLKLDTSMDAENLPTGPTAGIKLPLAGTGQPLRDTTNVTVTLTLSASAAEDVNQVLCRLAALLRVPPPTGYQVIEKTPTPASQRLGLYRFKNKDGKEGAPVDIQSILNGTAKFCRHCDVVILGQNRITKKAQLFAQGQQQPVDEDDDEDYHFCSTACFVQFAVANNTRPSLIEAKEANAVVDHVCHSVNSTTAHPQSSLAASAAAASVVAAAAAKAVRTPELTSITTPPITALQNGPVAPKWKGVRYRNWSVSFSQTAGKAHHVKKLSDNELTEMLYRAGICIRPTTEKATDQRTCLFCGGQGDGVSDGPARLLNYDVDRYVHLNCALWHEEVYETVNGALMNVDAALKASLTQICLHCGRNGASVKCFKLRCSSVYHLGCAVKEGCVFLKNKAVYCSQHVPKCSSNNSTSVVDIKEEQLTTLAVYRRVYINREENRQVATVMHQHGTAGLLEESNDPSEQSFLLRVGSLTFLSVGQLLPHQLAAFHSNTCIFPIGYQIVRFYWSPRVVHKRCRYVCSIEESDGRPQFIVVVQEPERNLPDLTFKDWTCQGVWQQILGAIEEMRRQEGVVRLFPQFLNGEDLFGLTEPAIVRVLESLPGIESLSDYHFKYGRNPLLELPLAINPTGAARCEPKLRTHFKRFHAQRTFGTSRSTHGQSASTGSSATLSSLVMTDLPGPYSKQFVHSKSSQYKKMKQEWRHNVYLARSKIQGLGLYAARDIEKHTMVIEYIGEMIRAELAECREKRYEAANRGIYMFRLDEQRVIDATLSGGLARYINHSCNPNCVAEAVEVDRDLRIIIFANRRIARGEELAYDYKFDIEDDHKIPCLCGAPNCRKWMN